MKKIGMILLIGGFLITSLALGLYFFRFYRPGEYIIAIAAQPRSIPDKTSHNTAETEQDTILLFGGDVMLSRVVGQQMVKYDDFTWPFRQVAAEMSAADLTIINLESPFLKEGDYFVPTGSFNFKADPQSMAGLKLAGVDIVNLANNHFGNQDLIGMTDTFDILSLNGMDYIGAGHNIIEAHQPKIREIKGIKYGFLGYAYPTDLYNATAKSSGIANMDLTAAKKDVQILSEQADIVIVIMHAGEEYTSEPNQQQRDFAHAVIDAGADLVVGHHPHWVQVTEEYLGKPIIYSLGNLVFDQMWSPETQKGALAKIYFVDGLLTKYEMLPVQIYDYGQPQILHD